MDTLRVDICYHPLRIGWAIKSGDIKAFRQVVKLSHTLWGGRFNPILVADREDEAKHLADLFRIDMLLPVGESPDLANFPKKFPHLINPIHYDSIFVDGPSGQKKSSLLDVQNTLITLRDHREFEDIKKDFRIYAWEDGDPLSDVFLMQFGRYPSASEIGIDYQDGCYQLFGDRISDLAAGSPIPAESLNHVTISQLSRIALKRHYSIRSGWDYPGFFVGDASNLDDLVCHWNLRAADIGLWFVDPRHIDRYTDLIPAWEKVVPKSVRRLEFDHRVAIWTREERIENLPQVLKIMNPMICRVSEHSWNGLNIRPPMMSFEQVSVLGIFGREQGKPKVSFSLGDKPFCGDTWFHTQHLVASVSFMGGLYDDEQYTLDPPFVPELNEFYSRAMHFSPERLRIEPERLGIVIDAADTDTCLYAIPVFDLAERIFDMAGYEIKLSNGGLIARQLISHLGGLNGARVFKIPGVRRLLKSHGPIATFTKEIALQAIGKGDPGSPDTNFSHYKSLYIEPRPHGTKLEPKDVFGYLVEKGLFRIGVTLTCPTCRIDRWIALDALTHRPVCELCGGEYDASRQLVDKEWHYRRSGILGVERNAQGAIPVVLTLQQLQTNLRGAFGNGVYSSSLNLTKKGQTQNECELDFVWIMPNPYPQKTTIILGECKDQGSIEPEEFNRDIANLHRVADALPPERFETFILFSKLSPFTDKEIEAAKALITEGRPRTILLTARELEPTYFFERTKKEFDIGNYGGTPEQLALATAKMYFATSLPPKGQE